MKKAQKITRAEAKEILKSIPHTAFFGCTFVKANGEVRKMNCNKSISVGLKNKREPISDVKDRMTVYDRHAAGYRQINLNTLTEIRTGKKTYIVG